MNVVAPAKVTRSASQDAASLAALFLTTETVLAFLKINKALILNQPR